MNNLTLKGAEEGYNFGFAVTYDGDNHTILFGTNCNHCGKYFENKDKPSMYCSECS